MSEKKYDGPPDYRNVGIHGMSPKTTHDEKARFNFLAHMNRHLASNILPGVKTAYETRVKPKNPHPNHRNQVRTALLEDPLFQHWSALRRGTMELRQQAGRWVTLRQADELNAKAEALTKDDPRLVLDPDLELPRYLAAIDHHCMPGSYHDELVPGDVTGAANYDVGIFVTTGGGLGRYSDGGGEAVVAWMKKNRPDFAPKRILDIGGGLGQNVLPIAKAYPEAEVVCVDTGAPVLRYGLARAKSLGIENVTFVQANAEDLSMYPDGHFDWVQSTMFLHETSVKSMPKIMKETHRLLAPGGLVMHVEQICRSMSKLFAIGTLFIIMNLSGQKCTNWIWINGWLMPGSLVMSWFMAALRPSSMHLSFLSMPMMMSKIMAAKPLGILLAPRKKQTCRKRPDDTANRSSQAGRREA